MISSLGPASLLPATFLFSQEIRSSREFLKYHVSFRLVSPVRLDPLILREPFSANFCESSLRTMTRRLYIWRFNYIPHPSKRKMFVSLKISSRDCALSYQFVSDDVAPTCYKDQPLFWMISDSQIVFYFSSTCDRNASTYSHSQTIKL